MRFARRLTNWFDADKIRIAILILLVILIVLVAARPQVGAQDNGQREFPVIVTEAQVDWVRVLKMVDQSNWATCYAFLGYGEISVACFGPPNKNFAQYIPLEMNNLDFTALHDAE